ncbi:MAG: hypothetical protein ABNO50_00375 [Candidatus Shikimatogenerans sp. Tduv]|uniref:Beta sliding clamp n=1 Tax=Candidatus Shikimatogenerans sp. Tduv TaxID=3158567 RepID=A0AAU7QR85_9FLAO
MKININLYKLYKLIFPILFIENDYINNNILNNIKLIFKKNILLVKYTNLNIFLILKLKIKNPYKKKILISYKKIINILKYIKEDIILSIKNKYLKIKTEYGLYKINTLKYKYYPYFINFENNKNKKIIIPKKKILYIIKYLYFIKYKEKNYMNGIIIKIKKRYIKFYNTNNIILSYIKIDKLKYNFKKKYSFYIKKNIFNIMKNYIKKEDKNKNLIIYFNNKYIKFIYNPIELLIKYKKNNLNLNLLLKNNNKYKNKLTINKNLFIKSIRRILCNTKKYNIVLNLKKKNINIENTDNNFYSKEKIIGFYKGKKKKILIEAKNLIEVFNIIDTSSIELYIKNNYNFIFIKNTFLYKKNINLIILITPLKL